MIVLSGARIFDGERFLDDHAIVVDGERIAAILPYAERPHGAARDLAGGLLAPGFIDVQVNGGGGALLNLDPTVGSEIRKAHADEAIEEERVERRQPLFVPPERDKILSSPSSFAYLHRIARFQTE